MGKVPGYYLFFLFYWLVFPEVLPAQVAEVQKAEHFSAENGLSQAQINAILQDKYGFLWIGTQDGLNRYDGNKFVHFQHLPFDTTSLSNNYVRSITEDPDHNLWIATDYGLCVFKRKENRISCFFHQDDNPNSLTANQIYGVYADRRGDIWIKTVHAIDRFDRSKNTFYHFPHFNDPQNFVTGLQNYPILEDEKGFLWFGSKDGLFRIDSLRNSIVRFSSVPSDPGTISDNYIRSLFIDHLGNLWIGTRNGLNRFDYSSGKFQRYYPSGRTLSSPENSVNAITEDYTGRLWIGTDNGYLIYIPDKGVITKITQVEANNQIRTLRMVTGIFSDYTGMIWIGSLEGLYKVSPFPPRFGLIKSQQTSHQQLSSYDIGSVFEDENGHLWIGTWGGGLNILNRSTGKNIVYSDNSPDPAHRIGNNYIHAILRLPNGDILVGTQNGVFVYTGGRFVSFCSVYVQNSCKVFNNNRIYGITRDRSGNIWFATAYGLNRYDPDRRSIFNISQIPLKKGSIGLNTVFCVAEDKPGNIWFGTDNGLFCYEKASGLYRHYIASRNPSDSSISSNSVYALFCDSRGILWVGTQSGLNRYVASRDRFITYSTKDGLPSNLIYAILEDRRHFIWLSTNFGIASFLPDSIGFSRYDLADGLQNYEYNLGAAFCSRSGEIFFGGISGLNYFHPDSLIRTGKEPKTRIAEIELVYRNGTIRRIYEAPDVLVIDPEVKVFHIDFAVLDFQNPVKNRYRYKLVTSGEKGDWIDLQNRNTATFASLSPGLYAFSLQGANADQQWSQEGYTMQIKVLAPFYRTTPALVLYIVLLGALIAGFIHWRTRNLRMSNKILLERHIDALRIEKQRKELEIKNKNITDSLRYAQRIQSALMPSENSLKRIFPESFIFFRPRDIVSGDFYWIHEKNGIISIATVDCTGHGVPGAFMSIIGYELLRTVTGQQFVSDPAWVLNELNSGLKSIFGGTEHISLKDGMDVAFVIIEKQKRKLRFAGAFSPLFIVRNDKILEIDGDRFSVALTPDSEDTREFQSHEIDLLPGDVVYMFSDGYVDQFGGPEGKKFKYRRFRFLLLNIYRLPMAEQKQMLEITFDNWKGENDQVDDVLLIGFKPLAE